MAMREDHRLDPFSFSAEGQQSTKTRRVHTLNMKAGEGALPGLPESYTSNSNKEELCLEFVRHLNEKFQRLYPARQPLFLTCRNEFGVEKFVSTTLRPTLLPFREVYDLKHTAEFVANYLDYEPLADGTQPPTCLPSPELVVEWGVGDCFDFSMLLCSFLLGAGYDAFVVNGKAPRWITMRDQSRSRCPLLVDEADAEAAADKQAEATPKEVPDEKYAMRQRGVPESKYLAALEAKRLAAEAEPEQEWMSDEDNLVMADKPGGRPPAAEAKDGSSSSAGYDPLEGNRAHCWVLVRAGKRDSEKIVFVEPTTGTIFPVGHSPYLAIDAIWNAKNYWINMQMKMPVAEMSFDINDTNRWEYVFIDPAANSITGAQAAEVEEEEVGIDLDGTSNPQEDEGKQADTENILDMPPSWVRKLSITRSSFKLKYPPTGQRTILYHKCKLELFADNVHDQGMSTRVTTYKDRAQTVVKETRETFINRRDKLCKRVRVPLEGKTHEEFLPGRPGSLKALTEWTGRRRHFLFYVSARQDGLCSREENIGVKIIETFEGRTDNLKYRSVTMHEETTQQGKPQHTLPAADAGAPDLVSDKVTVKFARNPDVEADEDIAKRTFYLQDGRIRTLYHYADSRITRQEKVHFKDRLLAAAQTMDGMLGPQTQSDAETDALLAVVASERDVLQEVRRAHIEANELLGVRRAEELDIAIDQPIFETASSRRVEQKAVEVSVEGKKERDKNQVDYLTPFLQHLPDPTTLTREDAQRARDNCLKSLKDRLLERANIIQTRLNDENTALSKRQATFQRNSTRENDPGADEEFEKFCSEAMFRIQILEQRLVSHEETALKKYQDLDEKLTADPRLTVLVNP